MRALGLPTRAIGLNGDLAWSAAFLHALRAGGDLHAGWVRPSSGDRQRPPPDMAGPPGATVSAWGPALAARSGSVTRSLEE